MVGDRDIHLILTKGVMAILDKSASHLLSNMVYGTYDREHSQLVTPTAHGNLLMGMGYFTVPENKGDTAVSREKLQEVVELCRTLIPALSGKDIITSFAGIRSENTKAEGGDFYIAQSEHTPGVIHAVIGSPGLTAAPAIARHVLEILVAEGLQLEAKDSFDPHLPAPPRFAQQSVEQRREMAAADGGFGKVVCRCELVAESEIELAIAHGARTLDGIKFRTRAGMGRCQSGFCMPRIMEMLSERLGIPLHEVTKRGGDSWLVIPMTRDRDDDSGRGSCSGE